MSTVPGPLIRFVIDQPGLSSAVEPAMRQLKADAQRASKQIADSWRTTAAQIRADMSRGVLSTQQLSDAQRGLVSSLQGQMSVLRQRNDLTTKELSNLKAMTLELERQKNALKTGAAVGITKGTEHALSQVGTQQMLGITRMFDALVNRYFGGAAGSAVRTLRDTAYYSSMAGKSAAEGGAGGSTSLVGKLFTPAGLATAGGVAAILAAGAATLKLSVDGGKLAVELSNLASKTGLTADSVIKLRSATSVLDVDFDRVVTGFRKFDQEITLASAASLPNASQKAKEAAAIFKALGVNIQQAAKDPFTAVTQLSGALSVLPDGATKTAVAVQLFGRGGMELLPVLDRLAPALNATAKSSDDLARAISGGTAKSMEDLKAQMTNFKNETDALEVSLAQKVIPTLVTFVGWINSAADAFHRAWNIPTTGGSSGSTASGSYGSLIRRPNLSGIDTGAHVSVNIKSLGSAAEDAANKLRAIPGILGTTGKSPKSAGSTGFSARQPNNPYEKFLPPGYINWGPGFTAGAAPNIVLPFPGDIPLPGGTSMNAAVDAETRAAEALAQANKQMTAAAEKLQEEINRQIEQYTRQADSLFKDLVSGKTKQFTKQFESDIEDIVLKPFQTQFENIMVGLFGGLNRSINGGPSVSPTGWRFSLSGIFGGLFGPGGTPGTFSGPLGLGSRQSTTQTMYVRAGVVNIGAGGTSSTGAPGGGGFSGSGPLSVNVGGGSSSLSLNLGNAWSSFNSSSSLYNNTPSFFSGGGFSGVGGGSAAKISGSATSFLAKALGGIAGLSKNATNSLASLLGTSDGQDIMEALGGLAVAGIGGIHGSVTGEASGAATTATSLAKIFGASNVSSLFGAGATPAPGSLAAKLGIQGPENFAQQLSGLFGGGSMLASGISAGGVGGGLEDLAGGAELGTAIMPGLGTIIGAAIGGLTGIIRGIFGGDSWSQRVANAQRNQAIYLPPSENFSFASLPGASISQTMGTGFGMVGNTGTSYGLPSNTPFTANSIYGPLNNWQKQQLNQWYYGLNPNEPFFGAGATSNPPADPFTGNFGGWNGKPFPTQPPVQIHLNLPGYVDANSAAAALGPVKEALSRLVASTFNQNSSGMATMARRVNNLP